jgi:hypothetical protein
MLTDGGGSMTDFQRSAIFHDALDRMLAADFGLADEHTL